MENSEECKTDLTTANQNYVSCIKIHGLEILPPILSDEKRKCMQYYRDLAIQVEEKIKTRKCKKIPDDSTESEHSAATYNDSEVSSISDSVVYSSDKSSNDELTYRSVMFTDSCRSDVLYMLNDSQNTNAELKNDKRAVELPLLDKSAIKNVPLNNSSIDVESDMKKCFAIESDINKHSEIIVNPESLITNNSDNVVIDEQLLKSKTDTSLIETQTNINCQQNNINTSETSVDNTESINDDTIITDNESIGEKSPLIRRNSYIIENPSPYLLALINQNNMDCTADKPSNNSGQHKRRRWNLAKAREKWSSIEQDLNLVRKKSVKRNDINFNSLPTSAVTSPETKMFDSSLSTLPNQIISKTQLPEKESDIPTNDKPKQLNNNKIRENATNGNDSRFIRSYATPLRQKQQKRIDSKTISPVKTQSQDKSKKAFDASAQCKKTDLGKISSLKQRKLSLDELKRNNQIKPNSAVPCKTINSPVLCKTINSPVSCKPINSPVSCKPINSPVTRSPEKSPKLLRNSPLKTAKSPNIIMKKANIPEQQIREMINKISLEQSNQMAMLLAKQRDEQEQLMKLFAEQQALLLARLRCTYQILNNQTESVIEQTKKIEIESPAFISSPVVGNLSSPENALECRKVLDFTESSQNSQSSLNSQSSPEDSLQTISPRSSNQIEKSFISSRQYSFHIDFNRNSKQTDLQIIDLELTGGRNDSNQFLNESFCPATSSSCKYTCSTDSLEATLVRPLEKKRSLNRLISTCSRQLFPTEKQIWAATKLCAATRGFLVRRLIKTERVQNLVKTIRDSLLCAMELHHEKADNIQPADVELHRRLIQQVTAACYAFHDTFFDLSTSEQMSIIAFDRERQKEKLLRPVSGRSSTSLSSTTQRVLERKLKRRSSDSISGNPSRCSSSRSNYNVGDFRPRTKSLGMQDPLEHNNTKNKSSANDVIMHRTMSYGANKKPWR